MNYNEIARNAARATSCELLEAHKFHHVRPITGSDAERYAARIRRKWCEVELTRRGISF